MKAEEGAVGGMTISMMIAMWKHFKRVFIISYVLTFSFHFNAKRL